MTEQSLFPDIEQRVRSIDAEILWLLTGKSGGPFGLALSNDEKLILSAIRYCRGSANAVTIREMRNWKNCEGLTDRDIKKIVRTLRINFRVPIGSSKMGSEGGYFLMLTYDDHAILRNQILDQVRAELAVLKAVDDPRAVLELLGQLQLEVS